jgi:surface protein
MSGMFYAASSFNQNVSVWDVSLVTNMTNMFKQTALTSDNYDSILIGWASQNLQQDVPLGAGSTMYCSGATARNTLVNTYGWTITDGGSDTTCRTAITDANQSNRWFVCFVRIWLYANLGRESSN